MFIRGLQVSERLFGKLPVHPIFRPACGAVLLGGLGLLYLAVFRPDPLVPAFYGNGYPEIQHWLKPESYNGAHVIGLLMAIAILKAMATCFTIGSGGAGGMFAPSLLMGAAVGGAFGSIVNTLDWFPAADPASYALVGMGAMVAATTRAPLTAILIVYEITRSYETILPLMLAAVISTIVGRLVFRESVYTVKLTQMGVRVGAMSDLTILRRLSVSEVPLLQAVVVRPEESAQRLLDLSEQRNVTDFVVADDRDSYIGMVTGTDLKAALVYREAIPLLQVNELQRSDLPTVLPDDTLDVVLDMFSRHDVASLAVLRGQGDGAVLGLITRSRLLERYQAALSED
jgi:CIC family chloride channel protein